MRKLFISADIEGTCGITSWDETQKNHADWAWFAGQMTREVAAAAKAALDSGIDLVLIKDAHDSARNLDPAKLPRGIELIRGWARDPFSMMVGLDSSFEGAVMTGYHNAAGRDTNPLSHTMTTSLISVRINGELASELMINSLIAAYHGVPVIAVTGDKGLCDWMHGKVPGTQVVPVNEGIGAATRSIHPELAVERIGAAVRQGLKQSKESCMFPMPDHHEVEICYREHSQAKRCSFYPGIERVDDRTLRFRHKDYYEVLRMMHFCM